MAVIISVLALTISFLTASMAVVVMSMSPPTGCATRVLLLLSPCLPFISDPPNNFSDTVPSACCDVFSSTYDSGHRICICYFLREPKMLGFPLNNTKLNALSSFCPINGGMYLEKNGSLNSFCDGMYEFLDSWSSPWFLSPPILGFNQLLLSLKIYVLFVWSDSRTLPPLQSSKIPGTPENDSPGNSFRISLSLGKSKINFLP